MTLEAKARRDRHAHQEHVLRSAEGPARDRSIQASVPLPSRRLHPAASSQLDPQAEASESARPAAVESHRPASSLHSVRLRPAQRLRGRRSRRIPSFASTERARVRRAHDSRVTSARRTSPEADRPYRRPALHATCTRERTITAPGCVAQQRARRMTLAQHQRHTSRTRLRRAWRQRSTDGRAPQGPATPPGVRRSCARCWCSPHSHQRRHRRWLRHCDAYLRWLRRSHARRPCRDGRD